MSPMPPDGSPIKRKDEMRLRLQKKLNTSKIDYHITLDDHSFSVPVSMKPDQMAMLEKKGQEGCQLLNQVMHPALHDVLTRLPWQCNGCGAANATHTFGAPIYVPPVGKANELERIVRETYKDDQDQTINTAHIRDKYPAFYCGSPECLQKLQKAAGLTIQNLKQKRDDSLERVEYRATYEGIDFYSLIRLTGAQLTALDGRGVDAAVVLDRCMMPGLKMILNNEISDDQPKKSGPWNCMICSAVPATEVYGSPMWIPADAIANKTEKFVREHYRSDGSGTNTLEHHHMRDKAPFFHCGSNECEQEVHRHIDKVNRDIRLSVKKKLGKAAPKLDSSCCCSSCGKIIYQSVKDTCPHCRATSYCNRQCRENAWPTHKNDCIPAWNVKSPRKSPKHDWRDQREKSPQKESAAHPKIVVDDKDEKDIQTKEPYDVLTIEIDLRDGHKHSCKLEFYADEDTTVAAQRFIDQLNTDGMQHDVSLDSVSDFLRRERAEKDTEEENSAGEEEDRIRTIDEIKEGAKEHLRETEVMESITDALVGGDATEDQGDLHTGWF